MRSPAPEDWQLLNEYATANSETAFRALVDRHAGMVYHAALRQIGNPHAAEEVTQAVFIALAQKASSISENVLIGGWLFKATRFAVLNLIRSEQTRRRREQESVAMQTTIPSTGETEPAWERFSPALDEALADLATKDREAVIVRYFGNKSHRDASLSLGISEDAAKKRLSRALERLRARFAKRGIVAPTSALSVALAAVGAKTAPSGIAAAAAGMALQHAAGHIISSALIANSVVAAMDHARHKVMALAALVILIFGFDLERMLVGLHRPPLAQQVAAVAPPAPPAGTIVVWDKNLPAPARVNVPEATLEQALDREAVDAHGYWSVDYAVYGSAAALQRLLDSLRMGAALGSGGWTNLCPTANATVDVTVVNKSQADAAIASAQNLPPGARGIVSQGARVLSMTAVLDDDAPGGSDSTAQAQAVRAGVNQAVAEGGAEGTLAPERLLADVQLLPRFGTVSGLAPGRESAVRLAAQAHANWTIIYTMRRSPLPMVAFKMTRQHPPEPPTGVEPELDPPIVQDLESWGSNRFEFTPEQAASHNQAAQNYLQSGGKGR